MSKINIEVSARHIHLSQSDLEKLFDVGYELEPLKKLSQKGEFAAKETATLKSAGGEIENVRVLGPVRLRTQVEVSLTDAFKLKIKPPIRLSDDLSGSAGAKIIGPQGEVKLKEGVIIAKRHIHASPADAKKYGVKNNQKVKVAVKSGERRLIFDDVVVRVNENYVWTCHIDMDEGNAAGIEGTTRGEVIL